jgi:hypothetical protein
MIHDPQAGAADHRPTHIKEYGLNGHGRQFIIPDDNPGRLLCLTFTGVRPAVLDDPTYFTPTNSEIKECLEALHSTRDISDLETSPTRIPFRHFVTGTSRGAQLHLTAILCRNDFSPPSLVPPDNDDITTSIHSILP